ncbi:XapX domain-containing protein [Falsiroseomonas ponticola]|jgi:XapX domain-containing protein|uniref:XapX domain-containing protein n=1 Tax=Falsiroseomonas ponticola TaxID=2786951 RepID=UPI0019315CED|nr:XapX domain-containing protein [Roseomonas ponticola]
MKIYLASLGAGLLVGIVYGVIQVRSPAPPVVALIGLLGILAGEQIVPVARRLIEGCGMRDAVTQVDCRAHLLGELPSNAATRPRAAMPD